MVLRFSFTVMLTNKLTGFCFKLVVVYGSPYEDGKQDFLDELDKVMGSWQGPVMIGGDFNLIRCVADKSNGVSNHKWTDFLMIGSIDGLSLN